MINNIKQKKLTRTGSILADISKMTLYYLQTNDLRKLNHVLIPRLIIKYNKENDVIDIATKWAISINKCAKEQREHTE